MRLRDGNIARLPAPGVRVIYGRPYYSAAWLNDPAPSAEAVPPSSWWILPVALLGIVIWAIVIAQVVGWLL